MGFNSGFKGLITFKLMLLIQDSCLVVSYSAGNNNLHIGFKCNKVWNTYTVVK